MSNKIKYLFIDDTEDISNVSQGLNQNAELEIEFYQVTNDKTWSDLITKLREDFDGLLLDWKLNGESSTGIDFDSEALAQQARKFEKDFPIVLCSSMPTDVKDFFKRDTTAKDLFDIVYIKGQLQAKALISLAHGYIQLDERKKNANTKITEILNTELSIDTRVLSSLEALIKPEKAIHEFAQFFLRQILEPNGLLIDEYTLAARLAVYHGLDENGEVIDEQSNQAWCLLKDKLNSIKYSGVFSDVYDRWWAEKIITWFKEEICPDNSPKNIPFEERFNMLNSKLNIPNLKIASLQKFAKEPYFWEACAYNKRAIDIVDAMLVGGQDNLYPWQDSRYICLEAAFQKRMPIHPLYESKFKMLRKKLSNK
jgi:hypothetical protein